jgi:hypothetical protein
MKASELRIGNWIAHEPTIDDWEEIIVRPGTIIQCEISPDSFMPIPLTEEWLLKFGWELDHESNDLKSFINYKLDLDAINFSPSRNEFYYNCWEDSKCPKYVHQLQNLYFAFTGEEIVVKE